MQNCKLFSFSIQMQYDIIKLNAGSIPFSNRKLKEEKKLAKKEKNERKKPRIHEYNLDVNVTKVDINYCKN